ncbi:hypothetical protein ACWDUN_29845 [Mycobacterium sp. NPDC003323]
MIPCRSGNFDEQPQPHPGRAGRNAAARPNATVIHCHSRTADLPRIVADADIVIAAAVSSGTV